jgi:putative tryptophan/tyrosine transport system substrate-binding protein
VREAGVKEVAQVCAALLFSIGNSSLNELLTGAGQGGGSDCQAPPISLYWGWTSLWPVILRNILEDRTMRRCTLGVLVTLALSLFATALAVEAQQATQVHRIGFLSPSFPRPDRDPPVDAFRQGLRELGYVEGQNLIIEYRRAEGKDERRPDLAAELVRLQVEVIVAVGVTAPRVAQHATRTIPIVMTGTADPVGAGLVASLARPGGNITGLSLLMAEIPGKRLEILKETVPQSTRVAVLANPAYELYKLYLNNLTVAARALGLHLHVMEVRSADELDPAFAAMTREGADALYMFGDPLLMDTLLGRLADLAATHRLPAMYYWKMYVEAGGLMSYGPSLPDSHRRAATYVDKILKGANPADLPVEQASKFELIINLKTAKAIGLTIPPTILFQADEVIQ